MQVLLPEVRKSFEPERKLFEDTKLRISNEAFRVLSLTTLNLIKLLFFRVGSLMSSIGSVYPMKTYCIWSRLK